MNTLQCRQRIDEIATADPERLGYGYSDSQFPWRYDPAIEHPRQAYLDFVDYLRLTLPPQATILQLGVGRRGGSRLAVQACGARVVSVDRDATVLQRLSDAGPTEDLIHGDSHDKATFAAVFARSEHYDCIILDADDTAEGMRADWRHYAPLVPPGGLIAIVDRSQVDCLPSPRYRVDEFVADLTSEVLTPSGVRVQRFGASSSIHLYEQTDAVRRRALAWSRGRRNPADAPQHVGEAAGCALYLDHGLAYAVPAGEAPYCPRAAGRNDYSLLLVADSQQAVADLAVAFAAAEPRIEEAIDALRDGDLNTTAAIVADLGPQASQLRQRLIPCLETAPWNRRLLLVLGMLGSFGLRPREGVLLLRRALGLEMIDADLLRAVANGYLQLLQDEDGARELLAEARRQVRRRKIADICHSELSRNPELGGNVLWQYPKLLVDVTGVLQVGARRDATVAAWDRIDIGTQVFVEAQPSHCTELERALPAGDRCRRSVTHAVLGAEVGRATLRYGADRARASLLPTHALAAVPAEHRQLHETEVETTTLDALVASGQVDPSDCNLLFIDAEGSELEVLQGAVRLLERVDLLCVAVFLQPVYDGAPMPQQIQTFLREFDEDRQHDFALSAFEVGVDESRGYAIFRRTRPRT